MTTTVSAPSPLAHEAAPRSAAAESLLARLDDPGTAAALHDLLDNAELLALLAGMVDGLVRRSETLTSNLADSIAEVRAAATGSTGDLRKTATDLAALLPVLNAGLPALQLLQASRLVQPATISALDALAGALVDGLAQSTPAGHKAGIRALLGELRDPATSRGLHRLLGVARALGRQSGT